MQEKLRVVAYCRVSTEMQEEKDSLATQIKGVELFCLQNNYELIEVYSDVMSGGSRKRAGFIDAKHRIDIADFDIFLAYDVSRIARDAFSFLEIYNKLAEKNIKLKFINNPTLDSDSPLGRLILTVLAAIMEFFRFDNSKKVRDWMITKVVSEGRRMAGTAPYGYKTVNKQLVIVEEEAEIIRYIFNEYLAGKVIQHIADDIKRSVGAVKGWLDNPTYAGINRFGKYRRPKDGSKMTKGDIVIAKGNWQPIISEDIFNQVKKMRDIQKENKARWSKKRAEYLLSGFTFHTSCGGKFRGSNTNGGRYKYYVCRSCGEHFKKDIFEKSVFDELLRDDFLDNLNKNMEDATNKNNQLKRLRKQLKNFESENEKALDFLMKDIISEVEFTKIKQKNLTEMNNIKESITNIEKEYMPTDQLSLDVIEIFRETLKTLDQEEYIEAKAILKKMIKRIDFKDLKNFNIYLNI